MTRKSAFFILAAVAFSIIARGEERPRMSTGWRHDTSGCYPLAQPPATWSKDQHIKWRVKTGSSNSAPVIAGDKVILMAEPDNLICLDRATGRLLWQRSSSMADLPPASRPTPIPHYQTSCGFTTPTPVCDGENAYVLLGNGVIASYTLAGERNWMTWLAAAPTSAYGRSSSPILIGDILIAPMSHLHAIDRKSGKLLWEASNVPTAYGTPAAVNLNGVAIVVTPTGFAVRASDGKILAKDLGSLEYVSVVADGDTAYFVGPELTAVKLSMTGESVTAKRLFDETLDGEYIASPVLNDGLLYTITSNAVYVVIDAKTGKPVVEPKVLALLPAGESKPNGPTTYASPALAGGMLYLSNTAGDTFVLQPGKAYVEVARNRLPDGSSANPTFAGKQLFVRAGQDLYCIEQ